MQVSLQLVKSHIISATAQDFVIAALAGLTQQQPTADGVPSSSSSTAPYYVALHVRPYPDDCLEYFVSMTSYDKRAAAKVRMKLASARKTK